MSITLRVLAFALLFTAAVLFASAFKLEPNSAAQNANSSTTTNKNQNQNDSRSIAPPAKAAPQQDFSKNTWELPDDADKTPNPVPSTAESIAKGKELYFDRNKGNCVFCHGDTGAGNEANFPRLRRKPADLTNKERMTAMTDGELFWKISKGITGIMPAGENRMKEPEERWHVVNYIRTLAKDKQ
ncbi:MAG TPA: cytochrome c [Pyrinomonadaceae bacterium]|nr:cytochrome c [Pyrinomonadaceae bacterium]